MPDEDGQATAVAEEQPAGGEVAPQPAPEPEAPAPTGDQTNINQLSLEDQQDEVDPTADLNAVILPPDGLYTLRLKAGQKGVYGPTKDKDGNLLDSPRVGKDGKGFFVADMQAYIVSEDPDLDGMRIWREGDATSPGIYATSQKGRSGTSAAAHIANCAGYPFQVGAKIGANAQHFAQLLAGEPSIKGMIQWQATKETGENDERGYPVRKVAVRGMKNFPLLTKRGEDGNLVGVFNADGSQKHNPRMEDPQDGTELVATAVITRFLPLNE